MHVYAFQCICTGCMYTVYTHVLLVPLSVAIIVFFFIYLATIVLAEKYFWSFHEAWGSLIFSCGASGVFVSARCQGTTPFGDCDKLKSWLDVSRPTQILMQKTWRVVCRFSFLGAIIFFFFSFSLSSFALFIMTSTLSTVVWTKNRIVVFRFAYILRVKTLGIPVNLFPTVLACCIQHSFRGHNLPCNALECPLSIMKFCPV